MTRPLPTAGRCKVQGRKVSTWAVEKIYEVKNIIPEKVRVMSQRGLTIVVLVTAVALVVGCGGGSSGPSTPQAVRPVQPAASSGAVVPAQGRLLGDLDNDGNPTVGDAIKILRIVVALDVGVVPRVSSLSLYSGELLERGHI